MQRKIQAEMVATPPPSPNRGRMALNENGDSLKQMLVSLPSPDWAGS